MDTGVLFCELDGQPLSRERVLSICQDLAQKHGIDQRYVDQDLFRGVFIRRALQRTQDRRVVELMVGNDLSAMDRIESTSA